MGHHHPGLVVERRRRLSKVNKRGRFRNVGAGCLASTSDGAKAGTIFGVWVVMCDHKEYLHTWLSKDPIMDESKCCYLFLILLNGYKAWMLCSASSRDSPWGEIVAMYYDPRRPHQLR